MVTWGKPDEHGEQCALIEWWNLQHGSRPWGPLLFAIPNGGHRSKAVAGKLKAEGVRAGVPDLFLAYPVGRYHGFWLELKTLTGKPSKAQREMMALLRDAGYAVSLAYGFEQAQELLQLYLDGAEIPN